jgi:hypothetical protein
VRDAVMSSNPADRVAANFAQKMPRLAERRALPRLNFFIQVFFIFFISRFAERRARQRSLCRSDFYRGRFAESCAR